MSLRLPFDNEVLSELFGSVLVLSQNNAYSPLFVSLGEVVLDKDGTAKGIGSWEINNGVLRICDGEGGLLYEFFSIETKNGCVYIVGRNVLESSVTGISRVTLHKKSPITTDIGICVSSHVDYEKVTLSRLFKSLKRDGFNMDNVFAIVGGDNKTPGEKSVDPDYKVKITRQKQNLMGFTAFSELSEFGTLPYWILLHDTCDVMGGFSEKIKSLDVGLKPDIILFDNPKEKLEIGIYSSSFIVNHGLLNNDMKSHEFLDVMIRRANVVVSLNSITKKEAARDIYGVGTKRETILFNSLGIRKFRGKIATGGKP